MTNQSLAKRNVQVMPAPAWTPEQIEIIKATVAVGVGDMELALFLQVAHSRGLDPFAKEIYAVMRWDSEAGKMKMVLQTGIDGYRKLAADSGEYAGQEGPYWCGSDGKWVDVWLSAEHPAAAKVGILRKGFDQPIWCIARWDAYRQTKKDGTLSKFWKQMGPEQLAKCAEAIGLRKAFPRQTAGLRTHEEMAQADNDVKAIRVEAQQAVAQEKLAQYGNPVDLPDDAPMEDIAEDPLPPSDSPTGKPATPKPIVGAPENCFPPRPQANPRTGAYLYPEQAEHLKLFAKAKKAIGEEAYRRALSYYSNKYGKIEKSTQFTGRVDADACLEGMRSIAQAQAKTRKLAKEKADAESNAASLLPSREGSGCDMPISNQIATYVKRLKWTTESANAKIQMHLDAGEDYETIMLRLRELVEREAKP